jgi:hypothetical protein
MTMIKAAFTKKEALLTRKLDFNIMNTKVKYQIVCVNQEIKIKHLEASDIRSIASYGAETRTLRLVDRSHVENLEMWCWGGIEKIHVTDLIEV